MKCAKGGQFHLLNSQLDCLRGGTPQELAEERYDLVRIAGQDEATQTAGIQRGSQREESVALQAGIDRGMNPTDLTSAVNKLAVGQLLSLSFGGKNGQTQNQSG